METMHLEKVKELKQRGIIREGTLGPVCEERVLAEDLDSFYEGASFRTLVKRVRFIAVF